jgi:Cof subfamily protein (haloacid dehalogenase superfamily)
MPPEVIFFDIDGTLFSHTTRTIPKSAQDALQIARDMGIKLFIATGRHRLFLEDLEELQWVSDFGFDGFVTLNGQICYSRQKTIYENHINPEAIKILLDHLQTDNQNFLFAEKNKLYTNFNAIERKTAQMAKKIDSFINLNDCRRALENKIYQLNTYCTPDIYIPIIKKMKHCTWFSWATESIDITPINANKAKSIKIVMDYFGFVPEKTAVFGDADNDAAMLSMTPLSVAMGNASNKAKSAAKFITTDIDNNGIWNGMKKLLKF